MSSAIAGECELRDGFEAFVEAARRLEDSYGQLKERAAAVDLELEQTNRRLADALAERQAIFDALPVGVLAFDSAAERVCSNPEGDRLAAVVSEQGRSPLQLSSGTLQLGEHALRVGRVELPDGGTLVVIEDRTHVEQLEAQVHRLDRLAGLSELALGVAHEIKNPLNGVVGYASLMHRTEDPKVLHKYADKVLSGLAQVDDIVRSMLEFARPTNREASPRPLDLVLMEAASSVGVPADGLYLKGAGLQVCVESSAALRVLGNLFRNSLEASVDSSTKICVEAEASATTVRLLVEDDGPGVPASLGKRILEPFVSTKERGHGLGLALAGRVLSFLGGSIRLLNPGSCGARFEVLLPRLDEVA